MVGGVKLDTKSPFRGRSLVGKTFGRLTVMGYAGKDCRQDAHWTCRCECGTEKIIAGRCMVRKDTKSCGCLHWEHLKTKGSQHNFRHGFARAGHQHPIYSVWRTMIERCTNPNSTKYYAYGARGITVCERWLSFKNFLADMGIRPTDDHQLDRRDNNNGYSPENCRWATRKEQGRNRRDNHVLEFRGHKASLAEWAEKTEIGYHNIKNRINNLKWTVERALTQPVRKTCHG